MLSSADLSPGGTWQLHILDRVSEFEEYEKSPSLWSQSDDQGSTHEAANLRSGARDGALLALPAAAQAHISLHPDTIPAGAFVTLDVRVPGEQEGAYAVQDRTC